MFADRTVALLAALVLAGCHSEGENNHSHDNNENNHAHGDGGNNHTEGDASHTHGQPDLGGIDFGDVTITQAAEDYCACLLVSCHDPFHEKYGEDDAEAIAACQREASGYPVAGSAQTSGDSIECRQHHCDNVGGDSTCEDALGAACS